jgi:hypothetical protein
MTWLTSLTIRQKELLTGFSIIFIVAGSFISAEAILRYQQVIAFGEVGTAEELSAFQIDEKTKLRLPVPNANMGTISFNSKGFRGPELDTIKKENTIRLGFIGSSIVFDAYTFSEGATWPAVTTKKLQLLYPHCNIEYFNAGVPGMGTDKLLTYYENFVTPSQADLLFIMTDNRNGVLDDIAIETKVHDGVHYTPSWLAQNSVFWAKVEKNAVIQKRLRAVSNDANKISYSNEQIVINYKPAIRALINSVVYHGSMPVLLSVGQRIRAEHSFKEKMSAIESAIFFMPYMRADDFITTLRLFNDENKQVSKQMNIPYIQWHEELDGTTKNYIDSRHFTPTGSAKLGEIIATKLASHDVIKNNTLNKQCLVN